MELGKIQRLEVLRIKDFGAYLGENENSEETVLLPKKEIEGLSIGDSLDVFIYKDSSDRLISTRRVPKIEVGNLARLVVKDTSKIGAFLDMGLERDLLLPYKEMETNVIIGDEVLVYMYVDRSNRLAATMRIYPYLSIAVGYKKDSEIEGTIYRKKEFAYLVAVDDKYYGAIPIKEAYERYEIGQKISGRVIKVREDGKLDISPRAKAYKQLLDDANRIYDYIEEKGGNLGFDDKAEPEIIKKYFAMSKNAFKRGVGHLLKENKIEIKEGDIRLK